MDIFGSHTCCNERYFTDYTRLYWNTIMSFDGEGFAGGWWLVWVWIDYCWIVDIYVMPRLD